MDSTMINKDSQANYIIVSPVKDEQNYIEDTIKSIIAQTLKPTIWVIVDDCSQDATSAIVEKYCIENKWIKFIRTMREDKRQPGTPVINAFNKGYEIIKNHEYDFIVKLDCDLRFESDYFERLILEFNKNKKLGIASGIYMEMKNDRWVPVIMPSYHAAGACKLVRKDCFNQIMGFIPAKGWDTIDEIKAQCRGWETRHFDSIKFLHLKPEGIGIGLTKTNRIHGEIYYATGGSFLFFIFKVMHGIIFRKPVFVGGIMMLWGYIHSFMLRKRRLVSQEEAIHYKNLLNNRILTRIKKLF